MIGETAQKKTSRTRRLQALVRLDTYFFGVISLFSLVTSFSEYGFHRVTLLRNVSSEFQVLCKGMKINCTLD